MSTLETWGRYGLYLRTLYSSYPQFFWSLDEVDGILLEIHKINPLGQIIELTHKIVFGEIPPLTDWLYTFGIVLGILFVGYAIFQKLEGRIVEEL